jgi:hypothetical protein
MPFRTLGLPAGLLLIAGLLVSPVRAQLIRDGEPPDLALLFTGDVIGYLDPCG